MASIYPPYALDPPRESDAALRYGLLKERETLARLRAGLPGSYTVFHSTHVVWSERGRLHKREADFLVMNQAGQVLMIEMKTGPLEERGGQLRKSYESGDKCVVTQLHDVMDGFRDRFRKAHGPGGRLEIQFLLYCPDHAMRAALPAGIEREQIVDASCRNLFLRTIQRLLPERPRNPEQLGRVRDMLSQHFAFEPDTAAGIATGSQLLTRLADDLLGFIASLEMTPYRLRLHGAAGCGKTQIVGYFAQRARAAARRCLVVCYNRPLADELGETLPDGIEVDTVHGLALQLVRDCGRTVDVAGNSHKPGFWRELIEQATQVALDGSLSSRWSFDTLVVDEG